VAFEAEQRLRELKSGGVVRVHTRGIHAARLEAANSATIPRSASMENVSMSWMRVLEVTCA
jgi:hypothetical protein